MFVATGLVLVLAGAGTAFLLPSRGADPIPQPVSLGALDPEVSAILRNMIDAVIAEPDDVMRWVRLGMAYEANEQPVLAQQTYAIVTERSPDDSRGWFGLAKVSAALGDIEAAERAMRRAIELEPDYAAAHWRLGSWLFEQGRLDEAAQHFQRATHIEEGNQAAWFGLARVHLARGDIENAVTILEWLAQAPPPSGPYAWQLLAGAYRQLGRSEDTETARLRGLGAAPDFRDPWQIEVIKFERGFGAQIHQAKSLLAYGKVNESIDLLKRLHARRPDDPMVLNNLATAYRAAGMLEESEQALRSAIELQPTFFQAHFGMALAKRLRAQRTSRGLDADQLNEEALAKVEEVLALNGSYAPAHALRGEILAALGRHEEASDAFQRGYVVQAQPAWLHQAAKCLIALEQWQDAEAILATVTRQAPHLAEAWSDYSIALARLGRQDEAEHALARARELAPAAAHVKAAQQLIDNKPQPEAIGP